jgi:trimethylamine--corrinoid protein Co-methyltransferase
MNYDDFEQWERQGRLDAAQRANQRVEELLASYQSPELDQARKESLEKFVSQRKQELETKEF